MSMLTRLLRLRPASQRNQRVTWIRGWLAFVAAIVVASTGAAKPVEFSFALTPTAGTPFAREISADVVTPKRGTLRVPAFFLKEPDIWAVRVRAAAAGEFRLSSVVETRTDGGTVALEARVRGRSTIVVERIDDARGVIGIDARDPRRFAFADGEPFFPIGGNLPWPEGRGGRNRDRYYARAFKTFHVADLNWSRLWMAHWSGMNLDWLPADMGRSPQPGTLSLDVAARWDRIIAAAEENGVFIQLVLQHHGQYSTKTNSNWAENPWNAANGGFLKTPEEFFTSPRASELTKRKYRAIVARWGYSPAIMAWELFNEVMWTDARHRDTPPAANDAVAAWHAEMAAFVRSIDVEHHLVVSSDDALDHPLYASMDFLQPHLYTARMLNAIRRFDPMPAPDSAVAGAAGPGRTQPAFASLAPKTNTFATRPIFYGEFGDENMVGLTGAQRDACVAIAPIVWASLMGDSAQPAQPWETQKLIDRGKISELAAAARFAHASGLDRDGGLVAFSPRVACDTQVPLALHGALSWKRMAPPTIRLPLDGREPSTLGGMPRHFGNESDPAAPATFPGRATILLDVAAATTARIAFADAARDGATARVLLDGAEVATHAWPALPEAENKNAPAPPRPASVEFPLPAGAHSVVIENPAGPGWFAFDRFEPGVTTSIIAAIGKRDATRVVLWLWNREHLFDPDDRAATPGVGATVLLDDLPAGQWRVTWWDSIAGKPSSAPTTIDHPGGALRVPTPPIARHAAVILER